MVAIQIAVQMIITVLAVTALAIRIEHRLTKIETDLRWVKETVDKKFNGGKKHESSMDLD